MRELLTSRYANRAAVVVAVVVVVVNVDVVAVVDVVVVVVGSHDRYSTSECTTSPTYQINQVRAGGAGDVTGAGNIEFTGGSHWLTHKIASKLRVTGTAAVFTAAGVSVPSLNIDGGVLTLTGPG